MARTSIEIDILDLLSSLTDKSLVVADTAASKNDTICLNPLAPMRWRSSSQRANDEQLARRHAEYFRDRRKRPTNALAHGSTLRRGWPALSRNSTTIAPLLEWALSQGHDVALGGAIAGALGRLWSRGGLAVEGRYWIEPALERISVAVNPHVAATLWLALAFLLPGKRKCEAAERAVRLYESAGDAHGAARALVHLALGLYQTGLLEEASETNARALAALREYGDKGGIAGCLSEQGLIAFARGAKAEARDLCAQALGLYKALGHEIDAANLLTILADLEFSEEHAEQALRLVNEAIEIDSRRGVDALGLAIDHTNSAAYRLALGDLDGGRASAREGLRFARLCQATECMAVALQYLALHMALEGRPQAAARLLGYVNAQFKELRLEREPTEKWGYETLMTTLGDCLSEAEIEKLGAEGTTWTEDQAVQEALN